MKKIFFTIVIAIIFIISTYFLLYPSLIGLISLLGDLKYSGITETCNICIRALRLMSQETGYSYEFLNIILFIIVKPLIILILTINTLFKTKIRYVILLLTIIAEIILFNFISEYYIVCSEFYKVLYT